MRSGWKGTVDSTVWESCPRFRDDIWLGSSGKDVSDVTGLMNPQIDPGSSWIILTTQCFFFSICNPSDILFINGFTMFTIHRPTDEVQPDPCCFAVTVLVWGSLPWLFGSDLRIFRVAQPAHAMNFPTESQPDLLGTSSTNRKTPVCIKRHDYKQKAASDTAQIQSCWRRWVVVVSPDPPAASAGSGGLS